MDRIQRFARITQAAQSGRCLVAGQAGEHPSYPQSPVGRGHHLQLAQLPVTSLCIYSGAPLIRVKYAPGAVHAQRGFSMSGTARFSQ